MTRYETLECHVGHEIECVAYGDENVSIECMTCGEVLISVDRFDSSEAGEIA